jgi:hypothetical protein
VTGVVHQEDNFLPFFLRSSYSWSTINTVGTQTRIFKLLAITRSKIDFELGYKRLSIAISGVGRWSIGYPFHLDKIMERKDFRRMTFMEILPENIIKTPEGRNLGIYYLEILARLWKDDIYGDTTWKYRLQKDGIYGHITWKY